MFFKIEKRKYHDTDYPPSKKRKLVPLESGLVVSDMTKKLLSLMQETVNDIYPRIVKCNDKTNKKANKLLEPLVLIVQNACDEILLDESISLLERISLCAEKVNQYNAGNCMLQSFVAFDQILKKLIAAELITMEKALFIAIRTTTDHCFVMVNDLVCDPWANYCGSWQKFSFIWPQSRKLFLY